MTAILHLDIETAPHKSYVWGLFKQNVSINQIVEPGYTLCWAAKWHGTDKVLFEKRTSKNWLNKLHKLLDEADIVVGYNSKKFDIPTINREFFMAGLKPPSPYKQVDLYQTVRSQFRFASNKLDYVVQQLGLGGKVQHKGMELWKEVMANKSDAWKEMKEYNKQDVVLTEKLYTKLLPWIKSHPVVGEDGYRCPSCGGVHVQSRGYMKTKICTYRRYQCQDCGTWSRERLAEKDAPKPNLVGIV